MESVNKSTDNKIYLTLLNGTGYIFEIEDYMYIRKTHHIVGASVGSCNARGLSANKCTLPVELMPWETQLLVDEGLALLVSKTEDLLKKPTPKGAELYACERQKCLKEQKELMKREKLNESKRNIERIMLGKRKKLLKSGINEKDIKLDQQEILKEISDNFVFDEKNILLEIPCAHPMPHVGRIVNRKLYDTTSLKYQVFRDFWLRGKFVTNGDTFGADFMIYPGDPVLYHSSHMVILLDEAKVFPLDLIAKVRLSVNVNKYCVFAYFNKNQKLKDGDDNDRIDESKDNTGDGNNLNVSYQTVFWQGNSDKKDNRVVPCSSNTSLNSSITV